MLCNQITELGDYADTAQITKDKLHIGVLIQAMRNESDRAKMPESSETFEDARKFIMELARARGSSTSTRIRIYQKR